MVGELTNTEHWWLWRVQRGLTQAQAALNLSMSLSALKKIEQGKTPQQPPRLQPLDTYSRLRLARRRSGINMKRIAELYGVSHMTLLKHERAGEPKLVDFWLSGKWTRNKALEDNVKLAIYL